MSLNLELVSSLVSLFGQIFGGRRKCARSVVISLNRGQVCGRRPGTMEPSDANSYKHYGEQHRDSTDGEGWVYHSDYLLSSPTG